MSTVSHLIERSEWWDYIPGFFDGGLFEPLYTEMLQFCTTYKVKVYGNEFDSNRVSCYFTSTSALAALTRNYSNLPSFDWSVSALLSQIKGEIEKLIGTQYDYCLVHIYRDGEDSISWHNDKEALHSDISSISFGASRKFRFRKINETKGWERELILNSGDVVHMKPGCQLRYKHCVPVEKRVKQPRINLTFRKLE